jgi:NAD(P)-dependent dehydrogenase (short-subunit alcohol dehydrogenase family)
MMQHLENKIAVVTGASRGAGRGIALVLGEEGATVYVTGRSVRGDSTRPDLPGTTIDDTAEQVTARGGMGIPVRCDHTVDAQVQALLKRVEREQGRIDVLVNNVWGGYEDYERAPFGGAFWKQPLWRWDKMFGAGVRAHYAASRLAVPLMIPQRQGLVVSTTAWAGGKPLGNLIYDLSKAAINRMAERMAWALRRYDIAVLALAPGFMRTEATLLRLGTDQVRWREVPELQGSQSCQFVGRAVAALAADPDVMEKTGMVLAVDDVAQEYGFTDIDG